MILNELIKLYVKTFKILKSEFKERMLLIPDITKSRFVELDLDRFQKTIRTGETDRAVRTKDVLRGLAQAVHDSRA